MLQHNTVRLCFSITLFSKGPFPNLSEPLRFRQQVPRFQASVVSAGVLLRTMLVNPLRLPGDHAEQPAEIFDQSAWSCAPLSPVTCSSIYRNAVAFQSPGSAGPRRTLGTATNTRNTPTGFHNTHNCRTRLEYGSPQTRNLGNMVSRRTLGTATLGPIPQRVLTTHTKSANPVGVRIDASAKPRVRGFTANPGLWHATPSG